MARPGSAQYGEANGSPQKADMSNQRNPTSFDGLGGVAPDHGTTSYPASAYTRGRSSRAQYGDEDREGSRSPSPYRRDRSPSPYRRARPSQRNGNDDSQSYARNDNNNSRSYQRNGDNDSRSYQTDRGYNSRYHHRNGDNDTQSSNKRKASSQHANQSDKRRYNGDDYNGRNHDRNSYRDNRRGSPQDDYHSGPPQRGFVRERGTAADERSETAISYHELEQPGAVPDFRADLPLGRPSPTTRQDNLRRDPNFTSSHQAGDATSKLATAQATDTSVSQDVDMNMAEDTTEYTPIVNEDKGPTEEAREAKRRRWAAIRAATEQQKRKENLLQQAILANASEVTTPDVASPTPDTEGPFSPAVSTGTGNHTLDPASKNSPSADSPSAADYDPTQDMLDDRNRAAKAIQNKELPSNAYRETNSEARSTLAAVKAVPVPIKKQKKEIDMFADTDDEDSESDSEDDDVHAEGIVLDQKLLDVWTDKDGFYIVHNKELVDNQRFKIIKSIGRGMFSTVVQAYDRQATDQTRELVAIKITRNNALMREAARKESITLGELNERDEKDKHHIIRVLGTFDHKGHLCIVMEQMSKNLRDVLREVGSGHGITLKATRAYARQMLTALIFLQECKVVHQDLKPDNILVSADTKTIKLADFGLAQDERDLRVAPPTPYIASRFYRAPECMLGRQMGYPADLWAVACTMYELWTGKILFTGSGNNQMMKAFIDCLGWPTEKVLNKYPGLFVEKYFELGAPLHFKDTGPGPGELTKNFALIPQPKDIPRPLKNRVQDGARGITVDRPTVNELNDFTSMLAACLHLNIDKRATAAQAIKHSFFTGGAAPKAAPKGTSKTTSAPARPVPAPARRTMAHAAWQARVRGGK